MIYKNARIFAYGNSFRMGAFEVTSDGRFGKLLFDETPAEGIDLQGATVIPGLIDVHIHGAAGADFSDGDPEGLKRMARHLLRCGVTSFAPASMTLPYETLKKAYACGAQLAAQQPEDCARFMGVHISQRRRRARKTPTI